MQIAGFQKLSLVDFPHITSSTIFTQGCNFRCPFCHNANIAFSLFSYKNNLMEEKEVLDFLKKRSNLLDGVCITGGEPTLQKDLEEFIIKIKNSTNLKIKLDTNGTNPKILIGLLERGLLDYVAMDVKGYFETYPRAVGINKTKIDIDSIKGSIEILKNCKTDYEFRTTVFNPLHTASVIKNMAEMLLGSRLWRLQEFKQSAFVPDDSLFSIPKANLELIIANISKKPENIVIYS